MIRHSLRTAIAIALTLLLTVFCACAPGFVGEERAKKAGLALMQQAFGVTAQDAHVEYYERAGSSAVDNSEVKTGGTAPTQIYIVTISDPTIQEDLYYAEVNAKTGVAYYASKNEWLLTSVPPQQNATEESNSATSDASTILLQDDGEVSVASDWVKRCFQKEVALMSADGRCQTDSIFSTHAKIGYFVTFADGSIYRVGFSWPAMDLNEVQVLGTEPKGKRP
ncbi:MAG: hypothetical protein PHW41_09150 [Eubacteriales bacterium]|nr:hypothetical protein [Eubacteriales bacterium]